MKGRRPLLLLSILVSFSASCETGTFDPWLSPTQMEVEGECDVFTGRIVADDWAGRPITWESVRVSQREREAILRTDLRTIRDAIDNYTLDKQERPKSLQDLVDAGYLPTIPVDPTTGKMDWVPDFEGPVLACSRGPRCEPRPESAAWSLRRTSKL